MENSIRMIQTNIMIAEGVVCFFLALFTGLIKNYPKNKRLSIVAIDFSTSVLLLADGFAFIFRGNETTAGFYIVRILNFLAFLFTDITIFHYGVYVRSLLFDRVPTKKLPARLHIFYAVMGIAMILVVISQFTGLYYTFDEHNRYVRSAGFPLCASFPFIGTAILLTMIIQYKKRLTKPIFVSLIIFSVLPASSTVLQMFLYGISLINISFGFSSIMIFVLAMIEQNDTLRRAATMDFKTGLPNSYGFVQKVEEIIRTPEIINYNAFYFDIKRFSQVNRKYGSEIGDEVIKTYATYLRYHLERDEILGRLGGNYFVALVKKENTVKFLNMLQNGVSVDVDLKAWKDTVVLCAIAGAYQIDSPFITGSQLLGYTSLALNIAKNVEKKPYVFLTPELQRTLYDNRQFEEQIPIGLKGEEFKVFYQPKVDIKTKKLNGAEALVRWEHEGKLIGPEKFIPLMENNFSVSKLDFYMLEHTCKDIAEWQKKGFEPPKISVNFSRRNLGDTNLAREINDVLVKYDVAPERIEVEITETLDEYPIEILKIVVKTLHQYGITVAIDDFGTGSSTMSLLRDVDFDVLKIDKSFVEHAQNRDLIVLKHIVQMAKELGVTVLAEGVENETQFRILKDLKCDDIQGFIFDKPLAKADFEKRLENGDYQ